MGILDRASSNLGHEMHPPKREALSNPVVGRREMKPAIPPRQNNPYHNFRRKLRKDIF